MAEQRLDAAQIRAAIEQMRGETVPQLVGTERDRDRGVAQIALQDEPDRARRNPATRFVDEKRTGLDVGRRSIVGDGLQGGRADWADALLSSLAQNTDRLGVDIQIGDIQRGEFIQAQTAAVKEFEDGSVAQWHPGRRSPMFRDA